MKNNTKTTRDYNTYNTDNFVTMEMINTESSIQQTKRPQKILERNIYKNNNINEMLVNIL